MSALAGLPVLTAFEMRAAEDRAIASGMSVDTLMQRAGAGVARWVARLAPGTPVLVLCGPGNNGGDGYVAARVLQEAGIDVRVAALSEPRTDAARRVAALWGGPSETIDRTDGSPVVVDALFGIGVTRPLESGPAARLIKSARLAVAVDLPSGLDADTGSALGEVTPCHVTLALGALKPAHLLQPGAGLCGAVRLVDIGIDAVGDIGVLTRPNLPSPGASAHKYTRGMVTVVAGAMPGAARLAAESALRSGAGYVTLLGDNGVGCPHALVRRTFDPGYLTDARIGCIVIGPGLGRDEQGGSQLAGALASGRPLVIDGDALHIINLASLPPGSILTPHAGEFDAMFGAGKGSKLERTRAAASTSGAVVVHKGADTVIAAPDGRAVIASPTTPWLSTAGTGDLLAGTIAAQRALGLDPFAAAQAGVWLHARTAQRLGHAFIADDLAHALSVSR